MASSTPPHEATAVVCIGMAGSGKTTFMQRINSYLHSKRTPPYVVNLDPAVRTVPFESNIDIRESIDYKEVMKQYNLGPNGGILTSLNLFATKVDQIMGILEKRCGVAPYQSPNANQTEAAPSATSSTPSAASATDSTSNPTSSPINHILLDTPGQIEVFVWSASGQILLSSLASSFPTVIAYIIDTPRTTSTSTFMSNMLYACSILYKTRLPMILVFNKTDVQDAEFAKEWMTDFEAFQRALKREEETGMAGGGTSSGGQGGPPVGGSGYMGSLLNSMSLMLEEFYSHLSVVGVSAMTGQGIDDFFVAVDEKAEEFKRDYRPELERRKEARAKEGAEKKEKELGKLMDDLKMEGKGGASSASGGKTARGRRPKEEPETISDLEDMDDDDDNDEEIDADYAEPDDYDAEMQDDGGNEDGLSSRYKQALADGASSPDHASDMSFARYIQKGNIGG
jgi:GTPase SAR1 family protein